MRQTVNGEAVERRRDAGAAARPRESAWKLSCVRCVRYVRSAPIARAAAIASRNAEVRRMRRAEQRVDHEHARAAQQRRSRSSGSDLASVT